MIAFIVASALFFGAKVAPAPPEPDRGIVLPLEVAESVSRSFAPELRRRLEGDIAAILQRYARLNVMTARDIRTMADIDSKRQLAGCDSSCASEIAAAMGARYVFSARVEPGPIGLSLSISLIDADGAKIIATGRAQGAKVADLYPQLPFAVDDAAGSLRSPGDPSPAEIQREAQPKLAVLPIRSKDPKDIPADAIGIVDDAAEGAALRLRLRPLSHDDYTAVVKSRGCAENDLSCALPAAAAKGVALGLGVSVQVDNDGRRSVWAALLSPAGAVVARAEAVVIRDDTVGAEAPKKGSSAKRADDAFRAAVFAAVDDVVRVKLTGKKTELVASSRRLQDREESAPIIERSCTVLGQFVTHRCQVYPHVFVILRNGRADDVDRIELSDVVNVDAYNPLAIPSGIRFVLRDRTVRDVIIGVGARDEVLRELEQVIKR